MGPKKIPSSSLSFRQRYLQFFLRKIEDNVVLGIANENMSTTLFIVTATLVDLYSNEKN